MKKIIQHISYITVMTMIISSCTVMSNYQSAKTVGKGNMEATGSYTNYSFSMDDLDEAFKYNSIGAQGAFGVSDKLDAGVRIERVVSEEIGINHLALSGKYNILENKLSVFVPVGIYFGDEITEIGSTLHLRPTMLGNFDINDKIEITPSVGYAYALDSDQPSYIQIGIGSGINLKDEISIRPELGYSLSDDGNILNVGVGLIYKFK